MQNFQCYERCFTLFEILLVVSIISLIFISTLFAMPSIKKSARDVQRKNDISQYHSALQVFANTNNNFYPSFTTAAGITVSTTLCTQMSAYVQRCIEDPLNIRDSSYIYLYQSNGSGNGTVDATNYVLWAKLENRNSYWVLCSNGRSGYIANTFNFENQQGACPTLE